MENVLLIEDTRLFAMMIAQSLKDEPDIELTVASTCAEASELVRGASERFSLALVDLSLPDAPRGEAVDLTLSAGIPTIVVSGNYADAIRQSYLDRGALDFIPKDSLSSLNMLRKVVRRTISNRSTAVMFVDDSATCRQIAKRVLERHLFEVICETRAEQALETLQKRNDIRIVITDHEMPGMNGFDLVRAIRARSEFDRIAVVGVSGSQNDYLSAKFLKYGANDFLAKPYVAEELYMRIVLNLELQESIEALSAAATFDALTGLHNRRAFIDRGGAMISACQRASRSSAVAMLDIDHFKRVNDRYGHDGGDAVLEAVADAIQNHTKRSDDLCGRLGGEEFALVFSAESLPELQAYLDRLRAAIENLTIEFKGHAIQVTASIGAVFDGDMPLKAMISAADENLYAAKSSGRNRVIVKDVPAAA